MLRELLEEVDTLAVRGAIDREITGLALDSRRVKPGDAFFALPGVRADGTRFAADAVAAGAAAVFAGPGLEAAPATLVEVAEPRLALAQAAGRFHAHPSRDVKLVAVTGTNGKTTTTYLVEAIALAAGLSAGVIGTTGVRLGGVTRPSAFTTPESPELQGLLADMRAAKVACVALEASSHALVQRRTWGLACDACVFTNLTQDHLDYHGTMTAYLDAKLMLFDGRNGGRATPGATAGAAPKACVAVVNADDPHADDVARPLRSVSATASRSPTLRRGRPGSRSRSPTRTRRARACTRSSCPCWGATTPGTRRPRSPLRARSAWTAAPRRAGSSSRTACPAGSSASMPASRSCWWWTMRTRPTRSFGRSPRAASTRAGACCWCSAAAATAIAASAR
jgi:UDP-N-acetylmuramyl tripeptide synthase